jgi:hypothetical protein
LPAVLVWRAAPAFPSPAARQKGSRLFLDTNTIEISHFLMRHVDSLTGNGWFLTTRRSD